MRLITRDGAAAEDLAQEAFLRLTEELQQGRVPDSPAAWLHRVGMNLATSRARHAAVERRHADRVARPPAMDEPESFAISHETNALFARAFRSLRPVDQQAILLAAQGYRGPEIAARTGRTLLAARTLLCRARSRMREALATEGFMAT
jgi:RNA polymerase sigma factor (sigma-70 family)